MPLRSILITGAAGNLGGKLRRHFAGRFSLRLIDAQPRGDPDIVAANLATWDERWVSLFAGTDVVFHFAADPEAYHPWPDLVGPNLDAMIHVYQAAARQGVRRFVFASSNHVMGGYQDDPGVRITTDLPPRPGLRYVAHGHERDSTAYASAKLFGERLGKCYAESHGMEVIAARIGWVYRGGPNEPASLPAERGPWFRLMWLSDRDFCHLMERCALAELPEKSAAGAPLPHGRGSEKFVIVHGMSANSGMAWDLESPRRVLGYEPRDDVTK
ncbi:MAG: NAD(P)-dependent oxidoreductase [Gemmataceae bacterium]|nr:NAD(P)-dependent oxidoreductase [Gemmataceae bacterium]MCI0737655.1 NAD(P)-dependent oxidoreductase [Gemmataceae bacterium]